MSPLRTRFLEDMQLHGFSPKTQSCYVGAVRALLAKHYGKSPDLVTEALCGIKFFFQTTLQRNWTCFKLLRPAQSKKLPVVLSREEVQKILGCVHTPIYRVCLTAIYAGALRLNEGCCLQIADLDTARMLLRVGGKGNKQRLVPLAQKTLERLRQLWPSHRSPL